MTYVFTVSPDFSPDHLSGWYIFNTWLQKNTENTIHLEMYNDFKSQRDVIQRDEIDLIYANPFDAAMLVRERGFLPLVKAVGEADEAVIAVKETNDVHDVADLNPGVKVAYTDDPDVHLMGMIMLEPGDLDANTITPVLSDSYVLVAKQLLKENADVGIFLAQAYDDLSGLIKKQLKVLVRSKIDVIHHSLMIGPKLLDQKDDIQAKILEMNTSEKGKGVLNSLGFEAWEKVTDDEMEFMIDLMDALSV